MRPLVFGNWKMNHDYVEAIHVIQQLGVLLRNKPLDNVTTAVFPPFVDLRSVTSVVDADKIPVAVGAQHLSVHDSGAHTGETSGGMLRRLGLEYVLVGHSERRTLYAMTDDVVAQTMVSAQRHGLTPVLCVGEPLDVRESDGHLGHVERQLEAALHELDAANRATVIIAYEPVWAIGTGRSAEPEQVKEMTDFIRSLGSRLGFNEQPVLYGGSVTANTAAPLLRDAGVSGFLVGGASLKADTFYAILEAAHDC